MLMPILHTERLRIRPPEMRDLLDTHRLFTDAGWVNAEQTEAKNLDERRKWLEWTSRNHTQLAAMMQPPYGERVIERADDNTFIGLVGVVPSFSPFGLLPYFRDRLPADADPTQAFPEVGLLWMVHSDHRRRGYAAEAAQGVIDFLFNQLNLRRVIATTEYDNHASAAVMRRLGMTINQNTSDHAPWMQVVGILENSSNQTQINTHEETTSV